MSIRCGAERPRREIDDRAGRRRLGADGGVSDEARSVRATVPMVERATEDTENFCSPVSYCRLEALAEEKGLASGGKMTQELHDVPFAFVDLELQHRSRCFVHPADTAKDNEDRILPISARLLALLEMARYDTAGNVLGPQAYVFGSAIGERTKSLKTAWRTVCRKAQISDLRFHDLRHEAGSRFLEAGWPLHHVQHMLGHADIKTTSIYLNATLPNLHQSMRELDKSSPVCTNLAQTPSTTLLPAASKTSQKQRNLLTS